jgi:syntaxin 8
MDSLRPSSSAESIPPPSGAPPRSPLPSIGLSGSGSVSKQAAVLLGSSTSSHVRETSGGVFAPYKDDPSSHTSPPATAPSSASHHFSTSNNPYGTSSSPQEEDQDPSHLIQSQRYMMEEQDQRLDQLSHSVNRQHHLSVQINDELDVHHGLLEELDTGIDRTSARLGSARRRLDKVAKGIKENSEYSLLWSGWTRWANRVC